MPQLKRQLVVFFTHTDTHKPKAYTWSTQQVEYDLRTCLLQQCHLSPRPGFSAGIVPMFHVPHRVRSCEPGRAGKQLCTFSTLSKSLACHSKAYCGLSRMSNDSCEDICFKTHIHVLCSSIERKMHEMYIVYQLYF